MSPRPRRVSDSDIVAAAARVIARQGPADFTLADVGREVGLAAATLSQRFGSKRELLLALVASGTATVSRLFQEARTRHQSPLSALEDALLQHVRTFGRPEELANYIAFLHLDLMDPEFHRYAKAQAAALRWEIERLLAEAVRRREVATPDVRLLARAVQVAYNGALLTWAVERDGSVAGRVREAVSAVLDPARVAARRR